MSGQFPAHHPQTSGTPVTMDNFSGWNHPTHQPQPQGLGIAPGHNAPLGTVQSAAHGVLSQALPFRQAPGSPSKATKFINISHNGAGSPVSTSASNSTSQTALTNNLRQNLHMCMNQGSGLPSKSSVINSTTPSGSIDLTNTSWTASKGQADLTSVVTAPPSDQNYRVISSVGVSGTFNGEVTTRTLSGVSVISNLLTSPNKTGQKNLTVNQGSNGKEPCENIGITNDIQARISESARFAKKRELLLQETTAPTAETKLSNSSGTSEPPCKKVKEEEGVSSSLVIVDSARPAITNACKETPIKEETTPAPESQSSIAGSSCTTKQDALDVESQLEALFAGIADDGTSKVESKPGTELSNNLQGTPNVADVLESKGSASKKGKGKTNGLVKSNDVLGTSTENTPKKKGKKKSKKDKPWEDAKNKKSKKGVMVKGKYVKEVSCDSVSNASSSRVRGPVVHLEGSKEAPTSFAVINAPSRQDDEDNDNKKRGLSSNRIRKIHSTEGKLSSTGLCGNSLISRYEANSSDPRWVCVFCKRGCHIEGLGDLFGPYLVNHDVELENSLESDADGDRKIGDKKDKKNKRSGMGQTGVLGLLAIPPLVGEQPQFMVWFHENCAVWAPTINLIGSRLAGLQEAVWVAVHSKCSRCLNDGANIGCVYHGCSRQVHFPCAQDEKWDLNDDTFISTCPIHKMLGKIH